MRTKNERQRKESLDSRNVFLQAYKEIVDQRNRLDEQILSLQKNITKPSKKANVKRSYVKKARGSLPLKTAIREIMKTGEPMTMPDIIDCLEASGLYKTKSKYLYVMINQMLRSTNDIKKVDRGLYIMKKKGSSIKSNEDARPNVISSKSDSVFGQSSQSV